MGAPKGSKNALGNKGGGRKSAYQELADAMEAHKIFFDEHNQDEIEEKIRSGKFSLKDRFVLTAMEGDTSVLNKAYHKAVPDQITGAGGKDLIPDSIENLSNEELLAIIEERSTEGTGKADVS